VKRPEVEKLDKILEKFAPPENCEYLVVPKVNEELWYDLNKFHRSNDLAMQNIQKYLIGGVSAVTSVLNAKYLAFCNLFLILFPFPIFSRDCGKLSPNNKDERG
jgi:hypothetical protein